MVIYKCNKSFKYLFVLICKNLKFTCVKNAVFAVTQNLAHFIKHLNYMYELGTDYVISLCPYMGCTFKCFRII